MGNTINPQGTQAPPPPCCLILHPVNLTALSCVYLEDGAACMGQIEQENQWKFLPGKK